MTREDAKILAPIIKAFGEGEDVQTKVGSEWYPFKEMEFNGYPRNYRIKPKPEILYANKLNNEGVFVYNTRRSAMKGIRDSNDYIYIAKKFVEET